MWLYDPVDQVPWDLVALVYHHVREPNVPQLRQKTFKCRYRRVGSNLPILLEKYAFYVRKDKGCRILWSNKITINARENAREGGLWGETDIDRSSRRLRESGGFPRSLVI